MQILYFSYFYIPKYSNLVVTLLIGLKVFQVLFVKIYFFSRKREEAKRKRKEFSAWGSDQITDLQGYNAWRDKQKISYAAGYAFTQENYLSIRTMQTIVRWVMKFLTREFKIN